MEATSNVVRLDDYRKPKPDYEHYTPERVERILALIDRITARMHQRQAASVGRAGA